jgi:hypothetical protein
VIEECEADDVPLLEVSEDRRSRCIRFDRVGDESAKTHPERAGEKVRA